MFEQFAYWYVNPSEDNSSLLRLAVIITAAVAASPFSHSEFSLRRTPYFVYSAAIFLVSSVANFVWTGQVSAINTGFVWGIIIVDLGISALVGFLLCIIAMARSRDAFGTAGKAFVAFLPIVNLILLIAPTRSDAPPALPSNSLLTGAGGILLGVTMLVAGAGSAYMARSEMARIWNADPMDPAAYQAVITASIKADGLNSTLKDIAAEQQVPMQIDATTMLVEVTADGNSLRFIYETTLDTSGVTPEAAREIKARDCQDVGTKPLTNAGADITRIYHNLAGEVFLESKINSLECQTLEMAR